MGDDVCFSDVSDKAHRQQDASSSVISRETHNVGTDIPLAVSYVYVLYVVLYVGGLVRM